MDKTLRTIRSEIEKNKEGIIPNVTLIIDTNILADHAWSRDSNITYLIEEIVSEHPDFLIVVPQICKIEFKLFFSKSLPEQYEIAYYISKDPEYGLLFDDALIFSFAKLVGASLESDSNVLFLTKDRDFEVGKVMKELNEVGVEVYFSSDKCVQRIINLLV